MRRSDMSTCPSDSPFVYNSSSCVRNATIYIYGKAFRLNIDAVIYFQGTWVPFTEGKTNSSSFTCLRCKTAIEIVSLSTTYTRASVHACVGVYMPSSSRALLSLILITVIFLLFFFKYQLAGRPHIVFAYSWFSPQNIYKECPGYVIKIFICSRNVIWMCN